MGWESFRFEGSRPFRFAVSLRIWLGFGLTLVPGFHYHPRELAGQPLARLPGWCCGGGQHPGSDAFGHRAPGGGSSGVYQAVEVAGEAVEGRDVCRLTVDIRRVREIKSGFRRLSETATRELPFRSAVVNTSAG